MWSIQCGPKKYYKIKKVCMMQRYFGLELCCPWLWYFYNVQFHFFFWMEKTYKTVECNNGKYFIQFGKKDPKVEYYRTLSTMQKERDFFSLQLYVKPGCDSLWPKSINEEKLLQFRPMPKIIFNELTNKRYLCLASKFHSHKWVLVQLYDWVNIQD